MKISAREQELLNDLEVIRRNGQRITIADFVKRSGYSYRSGIQRFPTLRQALHDYCVVQPGRRHLPAPRADVAERAMQEREAKAQAREMEGLRKRLDEAEARIATQAAAAADHDAVTRERDALRAVVSSLVAQIAQKSVSRAVDIEREILVVAAKYVEGIPTEPPPPATPRAKGTRTALRLAKGNQ
jgi:hypothetical protein